MLFKEASSRTESESSYPRRIPDDMFTSQNCKWEMLFKVVLSSRIESESSCSVWENPRQYVYFSNSLINQMKNGSVVHPKFVLLKNRTSVNGGKLWTRFYQRRRNTKLRMPQPLAGTSLTSFSRQFSEKLCGHYKSKIRLPKILTPRVAQKYVLQ